MDNPSQPGFGFSDAGGLAKQSRSRLWSAETGYATGDSTPFPTPLPTPFPTPTKRFEFPKVDTLARNQSNFAQKSVEVVREEFLIAGIDSAFLTADQKANIFDDPTAQSVNPVPALGEKRSALKLRAITKKTNIQDEDAAKDDEAIWKLAERLADLRLSLYEKGLWTFDKEIPKEKEDDEEIVVKRSAFQDATYTGGGGWKYPPTVFVPSLGPEKRRFMRKKKPKPTCEFCYNNNNPDWESHRCKNEYGEVLCPALSSLICPECGATGKQAHTKRYCPHAERRKRRELEIGMRGSGYPKSF